MREKIADVVFNMRYGNCNSDTVAKEIIDVMAGMIKPLVWERSHLIELGETAMAGLGVRYVLTWKFSEGTECEDTFLTVTKGGVVFYSEWVFDSDTAKASANAKAAANAHHVATIMGAFE